MIETIFILLIAFQAKHFLADFPLQNKYMLGKFYQENRNWIPPLLAHVSVHGAFTAIISLITLAAFGFGGWSALVIGVSLAVCDMIIHFIMDRIKASPFIWGKYSIDQKQFWLALGTDQTVHHLTHYAIIGALVFAII